MSKNASMNPHPTEKEIKYIRESLAAFNEERVGDDGHAALHMVAYDQAGDICGGILGGTYWGWLYIDILWVREDCRRAGIGSALLSKAEQEALRRGCHHAHVDTMSWQAPAFYQKHGYEIIGVLPNIPEGNQKYLLMKALGEKSNG